MTYFCWSNRKITGVRKFCHAKTVAWSYDMEGHAWKCVERCCQLANKKVEQLYKVPSPCLDNHRFKKEEHEICWRIVRSVLTNCLEILVLGTNWTTWHSLVSQQACESSHEMDSCMWQTMSKKETTHSSHKWLPTILSCGWRHSIADWVCSKTQTLLAILRTLEINFQWCFVYFLEVEHLSPSVGCARNKRQCPTVPQSHRHCRICCDFFGFARFTSHTRKLWKNRKK